MSAETMRARFHLDRARGLVNALAERAAIETLAPLKPATTLATSLRVLREEIDRAVLALDPPRPFTRRAP